MKPRLAYGSSLKTRRSNAAKTIQRRWRSRKNMRALKRFRSGNLHNFHRSEWRSNQTVTCDATGFASLGQEFRLDQIDDYLSFGNLFDAFRISAVAFEIIPLNNDYNLPNIQPQVAIAVDRDDSNPPTEMEKLLCRKYAKLRPFNRKITKFVKPNVSSAVYSAGVAQDYKQGYQPAWLDLPDGSNVSHYGMKIGFQASSLQVITFHLRIKYYLQFKEPIVR